MIEEQFDHIRAIRDDGVMQRRRTTLIVARVYVRAVADQVGGDIFFSGPGRVMQWRRPNGIARVDRDAAGNQRFNLLEIAGTRGFVKLLDAFLGAESRQKSRAGDEKPRGFRTEPKRAHETPAITWFQRPTGRIPLPNPVNPRCFGPSRGQSFPRG